MASAQNVPIEVSFTLLDVLEPLPGATVRLVLGASSDWQNANAGHKFVTDSKGEAHFTMDGIIEKRWRSQSIPFTPFRFPIRVDHMMIAVELEHRFQFVKDAPFQEFRWLLTMDLDRVGGGSCRTVGFMGIYTPDAQGRFTKPLPRRAGTESWTIPDLNHQVVWGMSYQVAGFMLSSDPDKHTLSFAIKRLPRRPPE